MSAGHFKQDSSDSGKSRADSRTFNRLFKFQARFVEREREDQPSRPIFSGVASGFTGPA